MLNATELRAGTTFLQDGQLWLVLKYEHTKMGRGTANIKVKVRNLETGAVVEKSFISGAKVEEANVRRKEMTFLYADEHQAVFMDPQTYEQHSINRELIESELEFLKEGTPVTVMFVEEESGIRLLSVELPAKLSFKVIEAEPGVKGDSAANMLKRVKLENGMTIKAPLFIKTGDQIIVDTRTKSYVERDKRTS